MPRRTLATLLILLVVVLAAALLPRTPAGRAFLLERVQDAAADAGWNVSWRDSGGNPWRRIELADARIRGPGVDASLARANVTWFAPGLLTGELPLWIEVEGGRIDLDVDALGGAFGGGGGGGSGGGGGGGLPVRPELRALELLDTEVAVGDAPYTLPDVRAEGLRVSGSGAGAEVTGRLATDEGSLAFDARVATAPLRVTAELSDVDARLGRTWWDGVTAGTAEGTARWDEDGARVDLRLRDGAIDAGGLSVTDVEGDVALDGGLVTAELSGTSLGGSVAATGRVDVPNRRWSASLRGTPRLGRAAERFGPEALPDDLRPSGEALVTASASGWTNVSVEGRVEGRGTWAGAPLAFRGDDVRYTSAGGLRLDVRGDALGGELRVSSDGEAWTAAATGLAYGPAEGVDAEARFVPGGDGAFTASGRVGGVADLSVDGELTDGAVNAFVSGALEPGGSVEGAVAYAGGEVTGAVRVHDWAPPGEPPLSLELAADGPPSALPLTLRLLGDEPWTPATGPVRVDADLRGTVRAVLSDGVLRDVEGELGPLSLRGAADPAGLARWIGAGGASDEGERTDASDEAEEASDAEEAGADAGARPTPAGRPLLDLTLSLAPTPVAAAGTRADVALTDARLRLEGPDEPVTLAGDVRLSDLEAPPGELAPIEGRLEARLPRAAAGAAAGLAVALDGASVDAALEDGVLHVTLDEHGVSVADAAGSVSGDLTLPAAEPLAGLRGEAGLEAGEATVRLEATERGIAADAALPAGARLFGLTLAEPLTLTLDLPGRTTGTVTGTLGSARLDGAVALAAEVPFEGTLRTTPNASAAADAAQGSPGPATLAVRVLADPWRATADGEVVLEDLAGALGLPLAGHATASGLAVSADGAAGAVEVALEAPAPATVRWTDGTVSGTVPTPVGPAELAGTVAAGAAPRLTATHPWGTVSWDEAGLRGGGTVPRHAWRGVEQPALPWSLASSGDAEDASGGATATVPSLADLELRVGDTLVRWPDGGPAADVSLPLVVGGERATLAGRVESAEGAVRLDLSAALPGGGSARVSGPLDGLALALDAPASLLADAGAAPVELRGDVSVTASADALAPSVDGVGSWRAGDRVLDLTLVGPPWTLVAQGPDVHATLTPEGVEVDADGARLGAFVPALAGLELDGELGRELAALADGTPSAGWRGDLSVREPALGGVRLRGDGEALRAEGTVSVQGVDLDVRGDVLPTLDVAVAGRHDATGLEADVRLGSGEGGAVRLDGSVRWPGTAAGAVALPEGELTVAGTLADLRVTGPDGGQVTWRDGELGGSLSVPLLVNGVPHAASIEPSGPASDPTARVRVEGPSLQAQATLLERDPEAPGAPAVAVEATVRREAWPAPLAAAGLGAAEVTAEVDASGAWNATVRADASPAQEPLSVTVDATGRGLEGEADWRVTDGTPADAPAGAGNGAAGAPEALLGGTATFGRDGATVAADLGTLDVAALARTFGLEASGEGAGRLEVAWRPQAPDALALEGDARLAGTVGGQEVSVAATLAEDDRRLRVAGLGLEAVAERRGDADWTLAVVGDDVSLSGGLAADLHRVDLEGTVAGRPASLRVARDDAGPLLSVATYAGAQATVAVRTAEEGLRATIDASAPARAGLPASGSLSAVATLSDGAARLEAADVALLAPVAARAELAGRLWPQVDLRGTVAGEALPGDLALTVRGEPEALQARASLPGLTLDARLAGATPRRLALSGPGRTLYGVRIAPGAEALAWSADAGWSGSATVATDADAVAAAGAPGATEEAPADGTTAWTGSAELRGSADGLAATVLASADTAGVDAVAELQALLEGPPWAGDLSGRGRVRARVSPEAAASGAGVATAPDATPEGAAAAEPALLPADARSLRIDVPLSLAGTLAAPVLTGEPAVSGAFEAAGTLRADPGGAAVALEGPAVTVRAEAARGGWSVAGAATDLPLDPWIAALTDPRLTAEVDLASTAEGVEGQVSRWSLVAEGGEASGTARLGDGVSVTARVDADLAALLGGGATGTVRGPLSLRAEPGTPWTRAAVSGALEAERVRLGGLDVDGEVALGGALPIPDVVADLTLGGPVAGPLRLSWRPEDERIELSADLAAGDLRADVRVTGGAEDLRAAGAITAPGGAVDVAADEGAVVLSGRGGWAGAEARLRPFPAGSEGATLRLPLAALSAAAGMGGVVSLPPPEDAEASEAAARTLVADDAGPAVAGVLTLALDPYAETWATGTVRAPVVAGVALPDLELSADGATVRARGEDEAGALAAAVALPDLAWELAASGLGLPADLVLGAVGAGEGTTGRVELDLHDARAEAPAGAGVHAVLELAGSDVALAAEGGLRGGAVEVDLRRRGGTWEGPVDVEALPTPAGRLSLAGRAAGDGPWPQAVVSVVLDGPVDASGTITAAPDAVAVDLGLGLPGGAPAEVQGRVWPAPVLGLSGAGDDVFRLEADGWEGGGPWSASGSTVLELPGARLTLDAAPGTAAPRATLAPTALPDARLVTTLPAAAPGPAVQTALREGLAFDAEGALSGRATWRPPLGLDVDELAWAGAWGGLSVSGEVRDGVADLTGRLDVAAADDDASGPTTPPLLAALVAAPFGPGPLALRLEGGLDTARLAVAPADPASAPGTEGGEPAGATVEWNGAERSVAATVESAPLSVEAVLRPGEGLVGEARLRDLPLTVGRLEAVANGSFAADGLTVSGEGTVRGPGRVTVDGTADLRAWLPAAYLPAGAEAGAAAANELSLRLAELDTATLPWLAERLPGLAGGLSAVIEVRGSRVIAQATAPELRTGGRAVPLRLDGAGDLDEGGLAFGGSFAGSPVQGNVDREGAELLLRLERFPIQAPVEAFFGPLDVVAEATGVARLAVPFGEPGASELRLATEHVRLERGGVVTSGTVAVEVRPDEVRIDAELSGDGAWTAEGTIGREGLDFTLQASDADATPLLGLVPSLARLGVGADGDLTVQATGTLDDPRVTLRTDGLELALAGSRYRLTDTEAILRGPELSVQAALEGVEPVGGRIRVAGDARLLLSPWRLEDAAIVLQGDLNVPLVGPAESVEGTIRADAEGRPHLEATARMGAPVRVEGTLWPLDLSARGQGLALRVPSLMLASSTTDVDLHLGYDDRFRVSGRVGLREGRFALGIRGGTGEATAAGDAAPAGGDAAGAPPVRPGPDAGAAATEAGAGEPPGAVVDGAAPAAAAGSAPGGAARGGRAGPDPALSRVVLDDIAVVGRRLSFSENFGSADFEADLRVGGTAAQPRVSGQAVAQRGTFRFSGRDFDLASAVATFEPSRGAYPLVAVEAVTDFEKREVLGSAAAGVSFESPAGPTFEVRLAFEAEVLPTPGEARPFRLDLDPVLTSDAVVNVPSSSGLSEGSRPLTEAELVSLVALGRLDLAGELAGSSGVAGGVAQSALDNAVDLLILSEIQAALSEALGLDLVEIRTSTLSSVLDGGDDPFGVSVRLGGYVNEELFASVEISRFGETSRDLALTNTLNLTYELGPVEFDLATSLGFAGQSDLTPVPELSAGLRYELNSLVSIETGATLSTPETEARFGVTLRW